MKTILARRACTILYDVLMGLREPRPFLMPANICPIVPITFFKARVPFEFVDIAPKTLDMDLNRVEARLRAGAGGFGGILYAHPYGAEYTPVRSLEQIKARYPELFIIDDRCLCPPELEAAPEAWADLQLYSTGYAKIVDMGFGGFAYTRTDILRHQSLPFDPAALGEVEAEYKAAVQSGQRYVYRDSDWLATDADLPEWETYAARVRTALAESLALRQSINAVYNALIPPEVCLADDFQTWRFNVRVGTKQPILSAIFEAGLFASSHYASLVGIMGAGEGAVAAELAQHVINLFNDHHYDIDRAERTAQIIRRSV